MISHDDESRDTKFDISINLSDHFLVSLVFRLYFYFSYKKIIVAQFIYFACSIKLRHWLSFVRVTVEFSDVRTNTGPWRTLVPELRDLKKQEIE